eukprot:scaffold26100_cov120-Isochrysis_galbana.AAC.2
MSGISKPDLIESLCSRVIEVEAPGAAWCVDSCSGCGCGGHALAVLPLLASYALACGRAALFSFDFDCCCCAGCAVLLRGKCGLTRKERNNSIRNSNNPMP